MEWYPVISDLVVKVSPDLEAKTLTVVERNPKKIIKYWFYNESDIQSLLDLRYDDRFAAYYSLIQPYKSIELDTLED